MKAEVSGKYEVAPGTFTKASYPNFGEVDLDELTLEAADSLVASGFDQLIPKKVKASKEPAPKSIEP